MKNENELIATNIIAVCLTDIGYQVDILEHKSYLSKQVNELQFECRDFSLDIDVDKSSQDLINFIRHLGDSDEQKYKSAQEYIKEYEVKLQQDVDKKVELFEKELNIYFKNNLVDDKRIKSFYLLPSITIGTYTIYPDEVHFDENYSGDNDEDIKQISDKYELNIKFPAHMYPK